MSRLEITESSMLKSSKDNEDNEIGVISFLGIEFVSVSSSTSIFV